MNQYFLLLPLLIPLATFLIVVWSWHKGPNESKPTDENSQVKSN